MPGVRRERGRDRHRRIRRTLHAAPQAAPRLLIVSLLLSVTFACGVVIAVAHVLNKKFIAPVYDVIANLVAFVCATAASALLHHVIPALFSSFAIVCWLALARRTYLDRR